MFDPKMFQNLRTHLGNCFQSVGGLELNTVQEDVLHFTNISVDALVSAIENVYRSLNLSVETVEHPRRRPPLEVCLRGHHNIGTRENPRYRIVLSWSIWIRKSTDVEIPERDGQHFSDGKLTRLLPWGNYRRHDIQDEHLILYAAHEEEEYEWAAVVLDEVSRQELVQVLKEAEDNHRPTKERPFDETHLSLTSQGICLEIELNRHFVRYDLVPNENNIYLVYVESSAVNSLHEQRVTLLLPDADEDIASVLDTLSHFECGMETPHYASVFTVLDIVPSSNAPSDSEEWFRDLGDKMLKHPSDSEASPDRSFSYQQIQALANALNYELEYMNLQSQTSFGPAHGKTKPSTSMVIPPDDNVPYQLEVVAGFDTRNMRQLSERHPVKDLTAVWSTINGIGAIFPALAGLQALEALLGFKPSLGEETERGIALELARLRGLTTSLAGMKDDLSGNKRETFFNEAVLTLNELSRAISPGDNAEILDVVTLATEEEWKPLLRLDKHVDEVAQVVADIIRVGNDLWQRNTSFRNNTRHKGQLDFEPHKDNVARQFQAAGLLLKSSVPIKSDDHGFYDNTWGRSRLDFRVIHRSGVLSWLGTSSERQLADIPLKIWQEIRGFQQIFEFTENEERNLPNRHNSIFQDVMKPQDIVKHSWFDPNIRPHCDYTKLEGDTLSRVIFMVRDILFSFLLFKQLCNLRRHLVELPKETKDKYQRLVRAEPGLGWEYLTPGQGIAVGHNEAIDGPWVFVLDPGSAGYLDHVLIASSSLNSLRAIAYATQFDTIFNIPANLTSSCANITAINS